jgi:O-antigen biosynthesis protein
VAGSWNQGVRFGLERGYTHFLILNNDILVHPHAIDGMLKRVDQGGVALVAAVDISGELRAPTEIFNLPDKEPSESPHPNFSCFMITKDTIDQVGWFDEGFYPGYFEDNDYHHRIKRILGDQAAITITTAMFYHYGSRTQNQAIGKPIVPGPQFEANRAYYVKKWGGQPGQETFEHPFNDPSLPLTHVTLSSHESHQQTPSV